MRSKAGRIILILALAFFSSPRGTASDRTVTHVVTEDETAWFLATLYYGQGNEFQKLLAANGLKRPGDLREGMELRILNPKYSKRNPGFAQRYADLWEKRQKALGLATTGGLPASKVVLPTEKIRQQDSTTLRDLANEKSSPTSPHDEAGE